jgi:hypothetical protein
MASVVGEDTDDIGAPLDLGVHGFEWIGRRDLNAMSASIRRAQEFSVAEERQTEFEL